MLSYNIVCVGVIYMYMTYTYMIEVMWLKIKENVEKVAFYHLLELHIAFTNPKDLRIYASYPALLIF